MTLGIDRFGDGPDLALIHGWGVGAAAWDELLPLLTPNFRVHRIALPGYGNAPDGADFKDTAAAIGEALPAGCTLCGWSLGGLLALQAAALAPQRVDRLVLCGATPAFVQRDGWPHAQTSALLNGFGEALAKDAAQTLQRFIALFNQGDRQARAITRTLAKALTANGLADHTTLARGLDWLRRVDLRAQVSAIAQPTLVIHGEADPLMPLAAAHWLAAALPDAQLEVFGGAAHAPFLNDRERFAQLLTDFCHAPVPR